MSDDLPTPVASKMATGEPVPAYANWFVLIGVWGLLLAVLNMFGMAHPTYHISWGGLLTMETTNAAFETASDGFQFSILGDSVFIAVCLGLIVGGLNQINKRTDTASWVRGLFVNDTWTALADTTVGGGHRTVGAWCLLLGIVFYIWFGIQHTGWTDVGVYSVAIALIASGYALNHLSRVPLGDDKID